MQPALTALFPDPLVALGDTLVFSDDPRPSLSMQEYLEPAHVEACLMRFAPQYRDADRRALVSIWIKYHFLRLIPPVIIASLNANWKLPVRAQDLRIIMGEDGLPAAFQLPDAGRAWPNEPRNAFERFADLLDGHLDPLIRALSSQVKLSPKVLWSSAGHYLEWILGELGKYPVRQSLMDQTGELISQRCRPDSFRNPLHDSIRYVSRGGEAQLQRERLNCCIRYKLPGKTLCSTCPHTCKPPPGYDPQPIDPA
ncbi:siderophore-iron reductase FhuF [Halopseudomonas laoshanensis]|uniref:Siderophore-iron reductase FhuF n=1 Tax=Halopseudomonas laoshanensis TaxID=2268758 RepID=A0A7V7GT17_9GAMM|nr:siderophore-iron reductase FhuF [Halopseudomonas laoshanensis]KAA0694089.1 siderophore-iron reductase FhuF [Halopseudomonas laoshanensis]